MSSNKPWDNENKLWKNKIQVIREWIEVSTENSNSTSQEINRYKTKIAELLKENSMK